MLPGRTGADPELCRSKGVRSYPTWEIDGNFYVGVLPLERLDEISGYSEDVRPRAAGAGKTASA